MKRNLCFLLVLAICLFALVGCSSSQSRLEAEAAAGVVLQTPEAPPAWGMVGTSHISSLYLHPDGTVNTNFWRAPEICQRYPGSYDYINEALLEWNDIVDADIGLRYIVGLKADGSVLQINTGGEDAGEPDISDAVSGWRDIAQVCAEGSVLLGLRTDGTVVAAGNNEYGQCNVSNWTDITKISAGFMHTLGLRADGTVVAAGDNSNGQCDVTGWTDIIDISANGIVSVGLKSDGTILIAGSLYHNEEEMPSVISGWENVVSVCTGPSSIFALTGDGKVLQYPEPSEQGLMAGAADWTDIVAISASYHLLGLKADGTILALGGNMGGECDVCRLQPETAEHAFDEIGCLVCGYPAPTQ